MTISDGVFKSPIRWCVSSTTQVPCQVVCKPLDTTQRSTLNVPVGSLVLQDRAFYRAVTLLPNNGCVTCGKDGLLSRCSGCHCALYCSTVCQTTDWPTHKDVCGKRLSLKFLALLAVVSNEFRAAYDVLLAATPAMLQTHSFQVTDSPSSSPSKSHSPQKLSPSPLSASSTSAVDELASLPTKLSARLDGERKEMLSNAKSLAKKEQIELAFSNCNKLFRNLSTTLESSDRRFRTPAIFSESNGEGFEVFWYPGLTVVVRATSVRCYDGKSPTPCVDLSSLPGTVFDAVSNWLCQQYDFDTVPIDEETDTEVEDL